MAVLGGEIPGLGVFFQASKTRSVSRDGKSMRQCDISFQWEYGTSCELKFLSWKHFWLSQTSLIEWFQGGLLLMAYVLQEASYHPSQVWPATVSGSSGMRISHHCQWISESWPLFSSHSRTILAICLNPEEVVTIECQSTMAFTACRYSIVYTYCIPVFTKYYWCAHIDHKYIHTHTSSMLYIHTKFSFMLTYWMAYRGNIHILFSFYSHTIVRPLSYCCYCIKHICVCILS